MEKVFLSKKIRGSRILLLLAMHDETDTTESEGGGGEGPKGGRASSPFTSSRAPDTVRGLRLRAVGKLASVVAYEFARR